MRLVNHIIASASPARIAPVTTPYPTRHGSVNQTCKNHGTSNVKTCISSRCEIKHVNNRLSSIIINIIIFGAWKIQTPCFQLSCPSTGPSLPSLGPRSRQTNKASLLITTTHQSRPRPLPHLVHNFPFDKPHAPQSSRTLCAPDISIPRFLIRPLNCTIE